MTHYAHFQHLSKGLDELNRKLDTHDAKIGRLEHSLSNMSMGGSTSRHAIPVVQVPPPAASGDPKQTIMHSVYIEGPASKTVQVPTNMVGNTVFVTMVGAGGAGAVGDEKPGAGGGAGKSLHRIPLSLVNSTGKLMITAGIGGDATTLHGTASTVEPEMRLGPRVCLTAEGGKAPSFAPKGGSGAASDIYPLGNGCDGADATDTEGGDGGASHFAAGGKGGGTHYTRVDDKPTLCPIGQSGIHGSGGGGSVVGVPGSGGHGFVLIEYPVLPQ